ncbi:UNVERIFIED_CONTAM: hypothetical protein Slati_4501000 [Sesamum latifolium]|uniref:Myb/SANT-like domain-containing protein n=1 Tax=Sesamum latifolium TaxID=2727402 RepID=A0AAW2SSF9_9LAMI
MASEGHYWQHQLFYCSHWTPDIEDTFVQALLEHHRNGAFHHDRTNCHAVMCALFDINAKYGSTFSYSYCQRRLAKLKIRHRVFQWITRKAAVDWDPNLNTLRADEYVREQISQM